MRCACFMVVMCKGLSPRFSIYYRSLTSICIISYFEEIESIAVRNAERVDVNMPGLAHNTHDPNSDEY
ncbi:MAG: hypothetical protein V3U62_02340 [Sedimenticolaceae bacterium]